MPKNKQPTKLTDGRSPKTEYRVSAHDWIKLPDGMLAQVVHIKDHILMFPMPEEYAAELNAKRLELTIAAESALTVS